MPLYDISEAARFVGVSSAALNEWIRPPAAGAADEAPAMPLLEMVEPTSTRLSFANLVEAHILEATRKHNVPSSRVQIAIKAVRKYEPGTPHPLLTRTFRSLAEGLDPYLERIDWDANNDPYQLFPMRRNRNKYVALNIALSAGHPVVAGTGVRVQHLSDLRRSGMSVSVVADRYGLDAHRVAGAIAFLHGSE